MKILSLFIWVFFGLYYGYAQKIIHPSFHQQVLKNNSHTIVSEIGNPIAQDIRNENRIVTLFLLADENILSSKKNTLNYKIEIYPNPTSDIFYIQSQKEELHAELWNLEGKPQIYPITIKKNKTQRISTKKLSSGVYLLKIYNNQQQFTHYKIIKK